jgi:hypothetical protein
MLKVVFTRGINGKTDNITQQNIQVIFCCLLVLFLSDVEKVTEAAMKYITTQRASRSRNP